MTRRPVLAERTDTELVRATLDGDRAAFAEIYDRYGNVIYTVCVRLLGRRDEAADCAADVFLKAAERLHQLRDPEKLKPWLYAIARNEVTRRHRQRAREVLIEEVDDMAWTPTGAPGPSTAIGSAADDASPAPDAALLGALLREATAGLTDRDRLVAELGLAQGLQGDDLAAALGVTTNNAYVLVHRVRDRLERSITAILVARHGRDDCRELDAVLRGWDGDLTVVLRKRVARHIDRCEVCGRRRKLVPAALFDAAPVLAAPIAIRQRVLAEAQVAADPGPPWSADGFPAARRSRPSTWFGAAAVLLVLVVLLCLVGSVGDREVAVATAPRAPAAGPAVVGGPAPGTVPAAGPTDGAPGPGAGAADPTAPGVDPVAGSAPALLPAAGPVLRPGVTVTTVAPGEPAQGASAPAPTPGAAVLEPAPVALDFGAVDTERVLTVTNTGGTAAAFTVSSGSAAVTLAPAAGSLAPGGSQAVTVSLNRAALGDGVFATALTLRTAAGDRPVPVTALGARAPVIVSVDGPATFGPAPAVNCAFDVVVTDDTAVASVTIEWRTTTGSPSGTTALALTAGHWRGTQPVTAPPGAVVWRVVARDVAGNVATSAEVTTPLGSVCTA